MKRWMIKTLLATAMVATLGTLAAIGASSALAQTREKPPSQVMDSEPFNRKANYGGSRTCGEPFPCQDAQYSTYDIVAKANECVANRLSLTTGIMSEFVGFGAYENCVIPNNYELHPVTKSYRWAVCCLETVEEAPESCRMRCHLYTVPNTQQYLESRDQQETDQFNANGQ